MDPGSLSVSVCVMMACLVGAAIPFSDDTHSCACPPIPPMHLTEPPQEGCYKVESRYRYQCVKGYLRKAGTSDLTRCKPDGKDGLRWITPTLTCLRDPRIPAPTTPPPPTPPPSTTATTATTTSQETTWNMNTSEDGESVSMESATHEEEDSGTQTTEKAGPMQNSTVSLSNNANSSTTSPPEVNKAATPTSQQTAKTVSTFNSVTGQRNRMKPTPQDSVTQATVKNQTRTSTISPSTVNSEVISPPGALTGEIAQAVYISAALVITCAIIGISVLLYRRRSKAQITLHTEEEMRPMNCASAETDGVSNL